MGRINLDQLSKKYLLDKSAAKQSVAWFNEQTRYLQNQVSPNSLMSNTQRRRDFIILGQMILFFYHPIGVDTLPYYDTLPLVVPFSEDADTFTGLNFHYLPPKVRVVLLANLLDFATNTKINENTRLKLKWQFLKSVSRYRGVELAVKKYRKDHVQSQFLFVPATQWFNAVMLPMERFNTGPNIVYVNKQLVWQDAMKYV